MPFIEVEEDEVKDRFSFMDIGQLKKECRRLEGLADEIALYEITNGMIGKSYVRVYVWERSLPAALLRAYVAFENVERYRGTHISDLKVSRLFTKAASSFASDPSEEGFKVEYPRRG